MRGTREIAGRTALETTVAAAVEHLDVRLASVQAAYNNDSVALYDEKQLPDGVRPLPNGMFRVFGLVQGRNKWVADVDSAAMAARIHFAAMAEGSYSSPQAAKNNTRQNPANPDSYTQSSTLLAAARTNCNVSRVLDPKNPSLMPPDIINFRHLCEDAYHELNTMPAIKPSERFSVKSSHLTASQTDGQDLAASVPQQTAQMSVADMVATASIDEEQWPLWFAAEEDSSVSILSVDVCASLLNSAKCADDRAGLLTPIVCQTKRLITSMMGIIITRGVFFPDEARVPLLSVVATGSFAEVAKDDIRANSPRAFICQPKQSRVTRNLSLFEPPKGPPHVADDEASFATTCIQLQAQNKLSTPGTSSSWNTEIAVPVGFLDEDWSWAALEGCTSASSARSETQEFYAATEVARAISHTQALLQESSAQSVNSANICKHPAAWKEFCSDLWQVVIRKHAPELLKGRPQTFELDLCSLPSMQSMQLRLLHQIEHSKLQHSSLRTILGIEQAASESIMHRKQGLLAREVILSNRISEFLVVSHMLQSHKYRAPPQRARAGASRPGLFRSLSSLGEEPTERTSANLPRKSDASPANKQKIQSQKAKSQQNRRKQPRARRARKALSSGSRRRSSASKRTSARKQRPLSQRSLDFYAAVFESAIATSSSSSFAARLTSADVRFDPTVSDMCACGICGGNDYPGGNLLLKCASCMAQAHVQCWQHVGNTISHTAAHGDDFCCSVCETRMAASTSRQPAASLPKHDICSLCQTGPGGLPLVWGIVDSQQSELLSICPRGQTVQYCSPITFKSSGKHNTESMGRKTGVLMTVHAVCAMLQCAVDWKKIEASDHELQAKVKQSELPDLSAALVVQDQYKGRMDEARQTCLHCANGNLPAEADAGSRQKLACAHYSCALRAGQLIKCRTEHLEQDKITEVGYSVLPKDKGKSTVHLDGCFPDLKLNTKAVCAVSPKSLKSIMKFHRKAYERSTFTWSYRLIPNLITFIDRTRVIVHPTHSHTCAGFIVPAGIFQGTKESACMYMNTIPSLHGLALAIAFDFLDSSESAVLHLAVLGSKVAHHSWSTASASPALSTTHARMLSHALGGYLVQLVCPLELSSALRQVAANKKVCVDWQWPELFEDSLEDAEACVLEAHQRELESSVSVDAVDFVGQRGFLQRVAARLSSLHEARRLQVFRFCLKSFLVLHEARFQHLNNRFDGVADQKRFPRFEVATRLVRSWAITHQPTEDLATKSSSHFPNPSQVRLSTEVHGAVMAYLCSKNRDEASADDKADDAVLGQAIMTCSIIPPAPAKSKLPKTPLHIQLPEFVLTADVHVDPAAEVTSAHKSSGGDAHVTALTSTTKPETSSSGKRLRAAIEKPASPVHVGIRSNKTPRRTTAAPSAVDPKPQANLAPATQRSQSQDCTPLPKPPPTAPRRRTRGTGIQADLDYLL